MKKLLKSISSLVLDLFGYKYLLNINTGEVHIRTSTKSQCGLSKMASKNKKYLTTKSYYDLRYTRYNKHLVNGCVHCNENTNKG